MSYGEDEGSKQCYQSGRGGDQVVSVLAFNSNDQSSNPADVNNFSVEFVLEKNENKQKRGQGLPIFKNVTRFSKNYNTRAKC